MSISVCVHMYTSIRICFSDSLDLLGHKTFSGSYVYNLVKKVIPSLTNVVVNPVRSIAVGVLLVESSTVAADMKVAARQHSE